VTALDFFARSRVRSGYLLAVVVLIFARPTLHSILFGAAVGLIGLSIRVSAAGHLHKQELLTVSGPYAYTRNPLYLGSCILTVSAAIAMHSRWSTLLLLVYFVLVYSFVMRREEQELRAKHGATFDKYASRVPLFFPRLGPANEIAAGEPSFSWAQYRKNHEYRAALGFLFLLVVLVLIWRLRGA
jgi:protein-S-isoprenylcysteine O-methyltransferase Ste14